MAKDDTRRTGWREVWGIVVLAAALLLFFSLISYEPGDLRFNQEPPNDPPANFIGPVGAWSSYLALMACGLGGYLLPFALLAQGLLMLLKREGRVWPKSLWLLVLLLSVLCFFELHADLWRAPAQALNLPSPGGALGALLGSFFLIALLGGVGTSIVLAALIIAALVLLFEVHPKVILAWVRQQVSKLWALWQARREERRDEKDRLEREAEEVARKQKKLEEALQKNLRKPKAAPVPAPVQEPEPVMAGETEPAAPAPARREKAVLPAPPPDNEPPVPAALPMPTDYHLPPASILDDLPAAGRELGKEDIMATARVLQETLAEFGIEAEVTNVERGPVVTRYELLPAPGIRVERIAGLSNNLALAMKAESIRVQAPIPGKGVVGIEVPNSKANVVFMREVVESPEWQDTRKALPLALGKDVGGKVIVGDLADMPHLLIAGATGAGKTVCMNSILAGLLMSRTPEQMRLMLIDPKIVEFSGYNNLPHLVVPVITEAKKVGLGLRWAINEMEKRYKLFAKVGVRNIKGYNSRPIARQADLFGEEAPASGDNVPDRVPYIVIIVDELADLMMVAQAEIESSIARLAQLSRAVGIHMIIATQRPSVNVITGTIKANFPARIAFQVAQRVDSRTILDTVGADKLLGKGDLLYMPPGSSKLIRAQGTYTTDQEINRIVEFIKQQAQPVFIGEVHDRIEGKTVDLPEVDNEDDLMDAAVEVVRQTRRASTSSLQRRLRIGYTRAARLMDILEEKGIVGPPRGSDPREILIDLDGEVPENPPDDDEEPRSGDA